MGKPHKVAMGALALALAGGLSACAMPGNLGLASSKAQDPNQGLATRALVALKANDTAQAIQLAEQAVAWKPHEASFRQLLASAYLAGGRYASAETAYRDALSLAPQSGEIALKLALVEIARGQNARGLSTLSSYGHMLDSSDVGLALALAGETDQAIQLLEQVARHPNAGARVRQNLALAYALGQQWDKARLVAAQDLPANLVEERVQQWAQIAKPGRPGEKMAQFMGIRPVNDPGMPVQLALTTPMVDDNVAFAEAELPAAPVIEAEPVEEVALAAVSVDPLPEPIVEAEPEIAPVVLAAANEGPIDVAEEEKINLAKMPALPVETNEKLADALAPTTLATARPALTAEATQIVPAKAEAVEAKDLLHSASTASNAMNAVVQLGSYSSREQVFLAWDRLVAKHGSLSGEAPVTARFNKDGKTYYRLGVAVASRGDGKSLCGAVKATGGACFVRNPNGDAAVALAKR